MTLSGISAREAELRQQLKVADGEIAKARAEFKRLQKELDSVREEYRYISDSEEAKAALREAEARMKAVAEKLWRAEELREQLLKELKKVQKKGKREVERARKRLPDVVRRFYQRRRELVEALVESVSDLKERLKPIEKAVERYYEAGEVVVEVAREAGEYHGGGWVFAANDLSPAARRLWRKVIQEEAVSEELEEVDPESLELIEWWQGLLEKLPRLRSDFPPCITTPQIERELKDKARMALEGLERRRREHRERLQRQGHLEAPLGERA